VTINLRDFLAEIIEYMDPRLDVDEETPGRKVMNQEGHLMVQAQDLLDSLPAEGRHRFVRCAVSEACPDCGNCHRRESAAVHYKEAKCR